MGDSFSSKHIDRDNARFRKLVRGAVRNGMKKYLSHGEMIGREGGGKYISIPLPQLIIPRFKYGNPTKGVGQGNGEPGDILRIDPNNPGMGNAGDQPGDHILEVELTLEELAEIMGEELELPRIEPRGKKNIVTAKDRYTGIRSTGPEALRHVKRTYKQALRRQIITGTYDPKNPCVWPFKEDKRYRSWKPKYEPESNAVIFYMMDVSGSMSDAQKELVRTICFWLDTWLKYNYKGVDRIFIIHDSAAAAVDEETFFHTHQSGGTMISSAYKLCLKMLKERFNPLEYNIYCFHFTDGDNFESDDNLAQDSLAEIVDKYANLFCYGQVGSEYAGVEGHFYDLLEDIMNNAHPENMVIQQIPCDTTAVYDTLKAFLGTGK